MLLQYLTKELVRYRSKRRLLLLDNEMDFCLSFCLTVFHHTWQFYFKCYEIRSWNFLTYSSTVSISLTMTIFFRFLSWLPKVQNFDIVSQWILETTLLSYDHLLWSSLSFFSPRNFPIYRILTSYHNELQKMTLLSYDHLPLSFFSFFSPHNFTIKKLLILQN